jgi:hypothetical protein
MALFEDGLACLQETLSSNGAVGWGQFCEVIHRLDTTIGTRIVFLKRVRARIKG